MHILENIMLAFLIVILIFVCFSKFLLKNDLTKIFGYGSLIVVTGSMEPTIHIKELIVIKEENDYNINDIVTYRDSENNLVTHRIVEKNQNKIVTRGDNNTRDDLETSIKNVEGKVIFHSIVLGELFLYWLKPIVIVILAIIIINILKNLFLRKVKVDENK